jgi:DNA-binding response OmpR family regulator
MVRILVIDDACWIREALRLTLEAAGYEVRVAADGEEGLRAFRRDRADVVLCDLCMPGKDGLETIRQFRQEWPGVPVVAMSGGATRGGLNLLTVARSGGACCILRKPFDRASMLAAVEGAVRGPAGVLP